MTPSPRVISFDGRTSLWLSVRRFALPSVSYFTLPEIFLHPKCLALRGFVSALTQVVADHKCQDGVHSEVHDARALVLSA